MPCFVRFVVVTTRKQIGPFWANLLSWWWCGVETTLQMLLNRDIMIEPHCVVTCHTNNPLGCAKQAHVLKLVQEAFEKIITFVWCGAGN